MMPETPTHRGLRVWTDGGPIPYIILPVARVDQVRQILTEHGFSYWVESGCVSFGGRPPTTVINFDRGTDAVRVQVLLDAINQGDPT